MDPAHAPRTVGRLEANKVTIVLEPDTSDTQSRTNVRVVGIVIGLRQLRGKKTAGACRGDICLSPHS